MFFANLKIKVKLYGAFMVLILMTLVITGVAVCSMNTALQGGLRIVDIEHATDTFAAAQREFDQLDNGVLRSLSPDVTRKDWREVNEANIQTYISHLHSLDRNFHPGVANLVEVSGKYVNEYNDKVVRALVYQDYDEAVKQYFTEVFKHQNEVYAAYGNINNWVIDTVKGIAEASTDTTPIVVTVVFAVAAVVLAMIISYIISRYIDNSLREVVRTVREISDNNFDVKLGIYTKDEFGILASSIRQMRDDLSDSVGLVVKTSNDLKKELDGLQSVSHEIASAAQNAEGQAITVAAATNEMVATTADVANNCENAARIADDTRGLTNDSMSSVRSSVDAIQRQSVRTREDGEKIRELAGQTQKIGSIVATIDEIAAQTNLLALNAAIEAARAGEAGRGFAVVADEVRALASRTSKSTQEISSMVSMIQASAMDASQSIADSVENFTQVADEAGGIETSLNQILGKVSDVNNQVTQISTAASEQTTATSEISTNMQSITSASQQITRVANDAIAKINHSVTTLDDLLQNLSRFRLKRN